MRASRPRQWAMAAGVSVVAHLIVFVVVVAGIEHPLPPPPQPAFTVMLERTPPPVETERPRPLPPPIFTRPKPVPPPPAPMPAPQPVPATAPIQPAAPTFSSLGRAGGGLGPAPKIGPSSPATALQMDCLGKDLEKLPQRERLACEQQIYAYIDSRKGAPIDPALDPTKRANYEAALARKRYNAAPVSRLGNAAQSGCLGSNMGMGCIGDNAVPMASSGDAADKFREGVRPPAGR